MIHRFLSALVLLLGVMAMGLAGIAEPPGDSYALDQQAYEQAHDVSTGLGPVFNARACVECHQNPVSGGASQFTELRVGHRDRNGDFVNPTIPIDDGAAS